MRRLVLGVVAALFVLGAGAGAASSAAPTSTVVVSPSDVPALLAEEGIQVPTGTCIADPALASCPSVSDVVVQLPTPWDSNSASPSLSTTASPSTPYAAPSASSGGGTTGPTPNTSFGVDACNVTASDPALTYIGGDKFLKGTANNYCTPGVGVTYEEVVGNLQAYKSSTGSWIDEASCDTHTTQIGKQNCAATYYCVDPGTAVEWREEAVGYAVLDGQGYFGYDTSPEEGFYCDPF